MRPPSIPTTIPINAREDSRQVVMMKSLYNTLIEFREPKTHRIPIQLFMCLPSRKDFPEYFNIISKPIAMNRIRERIERQQYPDVDSCLLDFKLMFTNCKFFNEDDSQIYRDAVYLESMLVEKRNRLENEEGRPSRDSKAAAREAILNSNSTPNSSYVNHNTTPSVGSRHSNHNSNNHVNPNDSGYLLNSRNNIGDSSTSKNTTKYDANTNGNQQTALNNHSTPNHHQTSKADINSTAPRSNNVNSNGNSSNGVDINNDDTSTMQSDSTNHSKSNQQNGKEDADSSIRMIHDHLNETSMDSSSNLSADILASTPIEKCSLNTRRGRNSDAPKRQLLTGYIIYASEIRKEVIDKNPNQNFGDISRLVGNEWKTLPHDIKSKYDQRALIHNKRVRERAQRELHASVDGRLPNGSSTPKLTKRKLAKLAKEQMRQHHLSIARNDDSLTQSPKPGQDYSSTNASQLSNSTYKHPHQQHLATQLSAQSSSGKTITVDSSTQTTAIRFVEPPTKKRLVYSESFRKYIEGLQVPNRDLLVEETAPERPPELPTHWLGAGIGRHESPEAALWALRDFMLQDAVTMRRNMEPYL